MLPEEPDKHPRPWTSKDAYKERVRFPLDTLPNPIDYRKEIGELKKYICEGTFPNVTLQVADIWIRKCMQLEEELVEAYKTIEVLKTDSNGV